MVWTVGSRRQTRWLAFWVGVGVTLFLVAGSGGRSYWFDEVASVAASRLPLPDLLAFLKNLDAVHGAYYLLLHGWMLIFGESEIATRSLSALSAGATSAALVVLGARLGRRRVGVIAAVIFALLPRTLSLSMEARSYSLSALLAVGAVILLLRALRKGSWQSWAIYILVFSTGCVVFVYSALMLVVHLVVVLSYAGRLRAWLVSVVLTGVAIAPVVYLGYRQRKQIAWILDQPEPGVVGILVEPVFLQNMVAATLGLAAVILLLERRKRILADQGDTLVFLAVAWATGPAALLLAADALVGGLYVSRYLFFVIPGVALLLALVLASFRSHTAILVTLLVLLVAVLPDYTEPRTSLTRGQANDYKQVAETIADRACAGDSFYLQNLTEGARLPRLAVSGYPDQFLGLNDIAFVRSNLSSGGFRDTTLTPQEVEPLLRSVDRMWVAKAEYDSDETTGMTDILVENGFVLVEEYGLPSSRIFEYSRNGAPALCDK